MNPRLENFIRVMIFTYLICKLITRLYICLVTPPPLPLWTDNFVPTPPNVCWTISHSLQKKIGLFVIYRLRWDRVNVESSCTMGLFWGKLSLLLLAVGKLRRNWVKMPHKTVPQCNSTQHGPRPRPHVFDYVWKRGFFPLRLRKNARTQVAYSLSRPHENAKTKFINLHFFSSF